MCILLAWILALPASLPQDAAPPAAPLPAPAPAPDRPALAVRYRFTTFGNDILGRSDLVCEARAETVLPGGRGVMVARFAVQEVLMGPASAATVAVLASPGEFAEGMTYVLFLQDFRRGGRYTALGRIPAGERDYAAKLRVLRRFAEVEGIEEVPLRAVRIKRILLEHLADDEVFVRWNALRELESFVPAHRMLFQAEDRAAVVRAWRRASSATYRRALARLLDELGIRLEEGSP